MQQAKTNDAGKNQVKRHDVIQQARHDQNDNAGDQRDDRLQMGDGEGHYFIP
jgi:hypothetical protein